MYLPTNDIAEIVRQIGQIASAPDALAVLFIAEKTEIEIPQLIAALNEQQITFVGGIFPGVIAGKQRYETGIVVTVMSALVKPVIVSGLNHEGFSLDVLEPLTQAIIGSTIKPTALVFVDGLTQNISTLLSRSFSRLQQNRVTYVGGGAGSLSLQQQPCVFSNQGFFQDAAVIALINQPSGIGVRHGWRNLKGPMVATKTNRNVVLEIGYQSAFKVYNDFIEAETGQTLTKENFFGIAKGFPLGIFRKGADRIVRDPITFTDEGGLVCVGDVPEPSSIFILYGESERLITHAERATREALNGRAVIDQCIVIDCISRVLFLEDRFREELAGVSEALPAGTAELVGALTLGEIGSYATGSVEFFNKTIVVSMLQPAVKAADPLSLASD